MNWIIEHVPAWNSWIALLLYWLPFALCAYGYLIRTAHKVREDRAKREAAEAGKPNAYYSPNITVGTLIGYLFLTVMPVANLFSAIFDVAPKVFSSFLIWCERALSVPLVPKRDK